MDKARRGVLKWLGLGGVTVAASAAPIPSGIDHAATGAELTAFRFQCFCGESIIAQVPVKPKWYERKKKDWNIVAVTCSQEGCHHRYVLTWNGDHFVFTDNWVRERDVAKRDPSGLQPKNPLATFSTTPPSPEIEKRNAKWEQDQLDRLKEWQKRFS